MRLSGTRCEGGQQNVSRMCPEMRPTLVPGPTPARLNTAPVSAGDCPPQGRFTTARLVCRGVAPGSLPSGGAPSPVPPIKDPPVGPAGLDLLDPGLDRLEP